MSGLLKGASHGAVGQVRPLHVHAAINSMEPKPPQPGSSEARIQALEETIVQLQLRLEEERARVPELLAAARRDAVAAALAAQQRDEIAAIAALEASARAALGAFEGSLDRLDLLSTSIAETALERVLGPAGWRPELTAGVLKAQLNYLRREAVLEIAVSAQEFSKDEALRALENSLASQAKVIRDNSLDPGCCRIAMRIGHLDLSLPRYWAELRCVLRQLSETQE